MATSSSTSSPPSSLDDSCHWRFSFDPTPSSSRSSSSSSSRGSSSSSPASLSCPRIPLRPPPGYPFVEEAFSNFSSSSSSSHHRSSVAARSSSSSSPVPASSQSSVAEDLRREQLIAKRGWEVAISPAKNLFMNFLMIYMGGVSSSGIFGILILFYVLVSCFSSALNVEKVFAGVDADYRTLKAKADNKNKATSASGHSSSSSSLSSSSSTGDAVYPSVTSSVSSSSHRGKREESPLFSLSMMIRFQKLVYLLISLGGCLYVLNHCANAGLLPLNSGDFIGLIPEREFSIVAVGNDL